jgi:hypothetical protein
MHRAAHRTRQGSAGLHRRPANGSLRRGPDRDMVRGRLLVRYRRRRHDDTHTRRQRRHAGATADRRKVGGAGAENQGDSRRAGEKRYRRERHPASNCKCGLPRAGLIGCHRPPIPLPTGLPRPSRRDNRKPVHRSTGGPPGDPLFPKETFRAPASVRSGLPHMGDPGLQSFRPRSM